MARTLAQRRATEAAEAAAREAAIEACTLSDAEAREELLRREHRFIAETDNDSAIQAVGRDMFEQALYPIVSAFEPPPTESLAVVLKRTIAKIEHLKRADSFAHHSSTAEPMGGDLQPRSDTREYVVPDSEDEIEEFDPWQQEQAKVRTKAPVALAPTRKMLPRMSGAQQQAHEASKPGNDTSSASKTGKVSSLLVKLPVKWPLEKTSQGVKKQPRTDKGTSSNSMIEQPQNLGLSYKGPVGKAMIDPEKQQATLGPRIRRESEKAKLMRENELFAKKDQATKEEAKREIAAIGTRMKKTSIVKKISRPVLPQIQQEEGRIGEEDATLKPYPTLIQWPSLIVHLKVPSMYKPASQPGPLTPRDHRQLSQTANNGVPLIDKKRAQSPENPSKLTQPPKPRRRYVGPRFSMNLRGSGASKVSPPQLATTAPIAGKTVQPEAQGPPPALHGKTPGIAAPPPAMAMEVDEQPIDREDQDNDPPTMSTQSTLPIREKRKTRSSDPIQPTLPQTTDMPTPRPRKMQKIAIAPEPFVTHTSNSTSNSNPASKPKVKPGILKQHPRTHSTSPRPGPGISEVGVPRRQSTRRIPDPPHMPTMPALPVQKTPKAQRDFQNGAMIALENVLEDQSLNPRLSLPTIISYLEDNKPLFTNERNDHRNTVLAGGQFVYTVLRTLHKQRRGLATKVMVGMVRRHVEAGGRELGVEIEGEEGGGGEGE